MVTEPERPLVRWHGGKWKLAPWISAHFPEHRIYIEPFSGGASVLLRKERAYAEVINDLDLEIVTLFRILRSPLAGQFIEALRLTPFARAEFELAYELASSDMEIARRLVIRSFMGFGSDGHNRLVSTGFRADSNKSGTTPAQDWRGYPEALPALIERLRGVIIENRPALEIMKKHCRADSLCYLDPPYMPDTRSKKSRRGKKKFHAYSHEMEVEDHVELLDAVLKLPGRFIVSGYASELYDRKLCGSGWVRVERLALADGARKRVEVLWMNYSPPLQPML